MRRYLLFTWAILFSILIHAQSFTGTGGTIPGTSTTQTCFPLTVTGVGTINATKGLAQVCININHPNDDELEILLTAPDGTVVPLSIQNGGSGNHYTGTCFTATAGSSIKFGTAPFNGTYLPEGHLGAVNNGQNANGTWRLCIQDRRTGANAGTLTNWNLSFNNSPAPQPPGFPTCSSTLPSSSSCSSATSVCDFNGLCGSTSGSSVQDWAGSGLDGCFGLQNNSFIKFVAATSTASFSVWVPTNSGGFNSGGIQMLFFSGTCNSGAVTTYGCYPHIFPYSSPSIPLVSVVTASGLTPGNTYYLMIDGFNNDNCTFTIAANSGVNILDITPVNPSICIGQNVNLSASGGNGSYSWSPAGGLSATSGSVVTTNPTTTTTYTVTSATAFSCPITKDVTVTVNPLPATPTASVTVQPTCTAPTGAIAITSPTGANLEYSINGSTYQAGTTFSGLSPAGYNVTARNTSTGCVSAANALTVNAVPVPPAAPIASVTAQPTCIAPTGTIAITSPTGANLEYSINGSTYQAGTTFSGLSSTGYNVTVRNTSTGCVSAATALTVNAVPVPPVAPIASVTAQPTCTVPTGTITVTAPTGVNLEYSVNGTNYQAGLVFNSLAPLTYGVTVKNINTGCISAATSLTLNAAPSAPIAPIASVTTQPSCTNNSGSITVTAPIGANLEYTIDGTNYQAGVIFNGLAPANYTVIVRNISTVCTAASAPITVNAIPSVLIAPVATVTTQPTCTVSTGIITITAPTGNNLAYSVNGTTFQPGLIFNGLSPANYNVIVKNTATGCVSTATPVTVNAIPAPPAAPTAAVTVQPTCTTPAGTIIITAPTGAGLEYSINGTVYQPGLVFSGLPPANYNLSVRNTSTGCVSAVTSLTINAVPGAPAAPTASVTAQPGCTSPTGAITITAPTGANLEYTINGTTWQQGLIFNSLAPANYNVTVRNSTAGCISATTVLTVNPVPAALPKPSATTVQPNCTVATGSITVTAPLGQDIRYSIDGINYQSGIIFGSLVVNTPTLYSLTAKDITTGCVSVPEILSFDPNPGTAAIPVVSVTQPDCSNTKGSVVVITPVGSNLEYSISGGNYQVGPVFSGLNPNTYSIVAKYQHVGCPSLPATFTITALNNQNCGDIYFPSAFSPNGDGVNDEFGALGNISLLTDFSLFIYNRYGEVVFSTSDPAKKWKGIYKSKLPGNNNYVWQAKFRYSGGINKTQKGNVTVLK